MKKYVLYAFLLVSLVGIAGVYFYNNDFSLFRSIDRNKDEVNSSALGTEEQRFLSGGLKTDTSIAIIDLDQIRSGLPQKDQIPALTDPTFVSLQDAETSIPSDDTLGIFLDINGEQRFYPYNIMVWHEIVNDTVGDRHVAVTFCPLCGTAIVFDPVVDEERLYFGVSGKLYESNLLMYDTKTESLWSQARGDAVVGSYTGNKLPLVNMQLLTFGAVKETYPNTRVLSVETGHSRNYSYYPYGNYDEDDDLFLFPVSVQDTRLPSKELVYAIEQDGQSLAIQLGKLKENTETEIQKDSFDILVQKNGSEIYVTDVKTGESIPGYYSMWFSWAAHHQESGIVWP